VEIGRVEKGIHILRTVDSEDYRRRVGRELNKVEILALAGFSCAREE
jgi:TnpA family transposase